jgi:hypothetical protein
VVYSNYVTTDSRPLLASKLNSYDKTAFTPTIIEIAYVLANVLTDIDSPYIAPYIIPNVYTKPVAAAE